MRTVVVVGAGTAGLSAAAELRRQGWDGRLVVIGEEPEHPYRRPPLSKEYLLAAAAPTVHFPLPDDLGAEWRLGTAAVGLDAPGRAVLTGDGDRIAYDGLVIATGAPARRLRPELAHERVHTLRTLADAAGLRAALAEGRRVLVVGAGFLGGELASAITAAGGYVTLVDRSPLPLLAAAGPAVGRWAAGLYRAHGVDYRPRTEVVGIADADGAAAVRLSDGTTVAADLVVAAIGASPDTHWLRGSGLAADDGVLLDHSGLAAPGVAAAGDVARAPQPLLGGEAVRVEHHSSAVAQGVRAARALLGLPAGPAPVPSFQSHLHGRRIHSVGFTGRRFAFTAVETGGRDEPGLLGEYRHRGRLVGAVATAPRHLRSLTRYRQILEASS